jgi:enoyl-CoA hydratase/carnithine racemase
MNEPVSAPPFETILLDVDASDHVATITLNRPDQLNAFNRAMCEEMAQAWRMVKLDESVHAVVLRAAGSRAFSAGLDVKTSYGQPENIWNHEDPGEALSPKWQKMWKPVVCAVQGMCTAGAFYFINESDVVICSTDATFFDSHVSAGLVCALEPIGLMRRIGLGETLRIALMGNDERVSADTALRIGLVSEGEARKRSRGVARRQATVGDPGHREGHLGVAGQALPSRLGAGAHLYPAGQPARHR